MTDIQTAVIGINYLRDFTKWVGGLRKDADVLGRVNEAMSKVGEVQDKLYELREENLKLLEENRQLNDKLRAGAEWAARIARYALTETPGGAQVFKFEGPPPHYACPSCVERKSIQVLQDTQNYAGEYSCPGCKARYPIIKPANQHFGPIQL